MTAPPDSSSPDSSPPAALPGPPLRRLGLTGSIGSGKSTVSALLRARGLSVLDADAAAHAASREPEVLSAVARQLGPQYVVDGGFDRPALARLVFEQPERRAVLNAIVHPRVRALIAAQEREAAARGERWVVQDVPLLFEGGAYLNMDALLLVDAPYEVRRDRVKGRDGLSAEAFVARDAAQMAPEEKRRLTLSRGGVVVDNGGDLAGLEVRVGEALVRLGVGL